VSRWHRFKGLATALPGDWPHGDRLAADHGLAQTKRHERRPGAGVTPNDQMQQTAPLGGRGSRRIVFAAASCSPFGEHRRRSSSAVFYGRGG
jgi:hypothetical protein